MLSGKTILNKKRDSIFEPLKLTVVYCNWFLTNLIEVPFLDLNGQHPKTFFNLLM